MKITFNRQKMSEAIMPLMCAVSGKSTLSASEGILIDAVAPNTCTMTTFDLEKGMRIIVEVEVEEEGSYIINAQKFSQTLKVMSGEYVTLTVETNLSALFECGRSTHRTGSIKGSDFPEIPNLTTEKGFVIGQARLKRMLSKTSYAMAYNDPRQVLNGCFIKTEGDNLSVVSCDGFKVAKCSCRAKISELDGSDKGTDFSFIMPVKTVNEFVKLLSDDEEDMVTVYMSHKNIVFSFDGLIFFSRLITGEYIDYNRIILKNHKIIVKTNKDELMGALEKAALITEERVPGAVRSPVKFEICENVLKVSANSSAGRIYDEVAIEHEGDDLSISFTNKFFLDSLRSCGADRVKISFSTALSTVNIEPEEELEDAEELFMLLPVRTKD